MGNMSFIKMAHSGAGPSHYIACCTTKTRIIGLSTPPLCPVPHLAMRWLLAELGDGLVQFGLLLREVLLVEPQQLLALSVLLLQAWRTTVKEPTASTLNTSQLLVLNIKTYPWIWLKSRINIFTKLFLIKKIEVFGQRKMLDRDNIL